MMNFEWDFGTCLYPNKIRFTLGSSYLNERNKTAMHSFGSACVIWNCTRRNDRRAGVRNLGLIVFYWCGSASVFSIVLCVYSQGQAATTCRPILWPLEPGGGPAAVWIDIMCLWLSDASFEQREQEIERNAVACVVFLFHSCWGASCFGSCYNLL